MAGDGLNGEITSSDTIPTTASEKKYVHFFLTKVLTK
jgi:hypothetical protein